MLGALREVCGELTVDHSTVSHWANRFRGGCVSIDNNARPGRPRTSTDQRSVKLLADALEEDRRETCEELSRATGAKNVAGKCMRTELSCSCKYNKLYFEFITIAIEVYTSAV